MKRKFITLFVALLVLAGIQTQAQKVVVIKAADKAVAKAGYASAVNTANFKLTYDGVTIPVYKTGAPNQSSVTSLDKVTVTQYGGFVAFSDAAGLNELALSSPFGGNDYNRFVVFQGNTPVVQGFNDGIFSGYLGINVTNAGAKDPNFLVVAVDGNGDLFLVTYATMNANNSGLSPLFIETLPLIDPGRWAIPSDFAMCKFHQFTLDDGKKLSVNGAVPTANDGKHPARPYDIFTVKQIDYLVNGDLPNANNGWEGMQGLTDFGTYLDPKSGNQVIPLFALGAPEDDCKVLSVSRTNWLNIQSQESGGLANELEVREWGQFYYYRQTSTWLAPQNQPSDSSVFDPAFLGNKDDYLNLQKFAIWRTEEGEFILYPVASYSWKYGEDKRTQDDNIIINSVLSYNNLDVEGPNTDKANGVQIGGWDGSSTNPANNVSERIVTAPNVIQTESNYWKTPFTRSCTAEPEDLTGRFFFLQVNAVDDPGNPAFGNNGYQKGREYVLSTQVRDGEKYLASVVKERNNSNEVEYWRFPYDSVNMAAHWELIAEYNGAEILGYRFINMLGDTLKFKALDVRAASTGDQLPLAGGYLPENNYIPGYPSAPDWGKRYFGRPEVEGTDPTNWFDPNPTDDLGSGDCYDLWTIYEVPGRPGEFFIELNGLPGWEISLIFDVWTNTAGAFHANEKDLYWQQDILFDVSDADLKKYPQDPFTSACPGLKISLEPIDYVPDHDIYHGVAGEGNGVNNTNDGPDFLGGPGPEYYPQQDSLTAYTFLQGNYTIVEALEVPNDLKIGKKEDVEINDGLGTKVNAASLIAQAGDPLEFIPLADLAKKRNAAIAECLANTGVVADVGTDTLYNETYKWYIVTAGDQYLSFDTLNVTARTNREKVGFVFVDDLANAVPVRLYQPLVGDKESDNFLFQFYLPRYTYYPELVGTSYDAAYKNVFPGIESGDLGATTVGGNEVCFATILTQSHYIYATRAYNGRTVSGTRFHIGTPEECTDCGPYDCDCEKVFVTPKWMADGRLLNFKLKNQLVEEGDPITAWIASGTATTGGNAAILTNTKAEDQTYLTHTYVTSIREYKDLPGVKASYNEPDTFKVAIPGATTAAKDTTWIGGTTQTWAYNVGDGQNHLHSFETDYIVPLYNIQNSAGQYLTVVMENDQTNVATVTDVNGVKLAWLNELYNDTRRQIDEDWGYDRRALQLFAIKGCEVVPEDGQYGEFVYLPLASYMTDFSVPKDKPERFIHHKNSKNVDVPSIFYNEYLGKIMYDEDGCAGVDITDCWRIGQYSSPSSPVKHLVVFNASSVIGGGSMSPIEVKLSKFDYEPFPCDEFFLVQNCDDAADKFFYTFDNTVKTATDYSMFAHWIADQKEDLMVTFAPELEEMYGEPVVPTELTGQYYLIDEKDGVYTAVDVSQYNPAEDTYKAEIAQLKFICTDHALPFYDLEEHYSLLNNMLAIYETPKLDRNLGIIFGEIFPDGISELRDSDDNLYGYLPRINWNYSELEKATFLKVYKIFDRPLTVAGNHDIPYYAFAIEVDDENGKATEYFLNVKPDDRYVVRWTLPEFDRITEVKADPEAFQYYVFCLPYEMTKEGELADPILFGESEYPLPPVFIQTLDISRTDYPYIITAGSSSALVDVKSLDQAMLPSADYTAGWNIYTADYSQIDPEYSDTWLFGAELPVAGRNIWVPLASAIDNGEAEGVISLYETGVSGEIFININNNIDVYPGRLGAAPDGFKLEYAGTTKIGTYAPRDIWYYRINLNDQYLTDASTETADKYFVEFKEKLSPYGYFNDTRLANEESYKVDGVFAADKEFLQTFGFRYLDDDDSNPDQPFYIVSQVNYKDQNDNGYRYLSNVLNQFIFVEEKIDALIFQFGSVSADGKYTDLEVIGAGGIYGVEGGVKFLNTTGKVDIYTIDGRLIKSAVLTGGEQTIPATRGIVIVKTGSKTVKVVVK